MASETLVIYGPLQCDCCCEAETYWTDAACDDGNIRCTICACEIVKPPDADPVQGGISEGTVTLRLHHKGQQTVSTMQTFTELAEVLGAEGDALLRRDNSGLFVEIPTTGIAARMELAKLIPVPA